MARSKKIWFFTCSRPDRPQIDSVRLPDLLPRAAVSRRDVEHIKIAATRLGSMTETVDSRGRAAGIIFEPC